MTPGGDEARSDSSSPGLAIVQRILDRHGGRITVNNKVDDGTRCSLEPPIRRPPA